MNDFVFHTPTKVVFGKGTEDQVGALVKEQGGTKVLVHFGGGSAKKSGLLDRVCASLEQAGIPYVTLGGVVPNPLLSLVYQASTCAKRRRGLHPGRGGRQRHRLLQGHRLRPCQRL